ncbi:hypothetical protein NQ317_011635 [Molorchus minor]|uniref:Uncharacterized protein n=1 Tax=Molorchus minor TaxID=1323400 RepID=A0ABQ9JCG4_9CUCU|nr:hypothetical protein NQ317_011635 [Molorchus minor]
MLFQRFQMSTADRLELVVSTRPAQDENRHENVAFLHFTTTLCDVNYIEERLNCVTELMKRPEALLSIQVSMHEFDNQTALLQKVPNIDLLLSIGTIIPDDPQRCSNRQLNYILLLNSLLDLITPLKDIVSKLNRPFYAQLKATLESEDFTFIRDIVRNTIQENAHPAKGQAAVLQRCFAIKPAINGLLDLVRKTYSERIDDMREYVKGLAEKHDLPLTLGNNQSKGHHIVLNLNQQQKRYMKKSDLPTEFIHVKDSYYTQHTARFYWTIVFRLVLNLDNLRRGLAPIDFPNWLEARRYYSYPQHDPSSQLKRSDLRNWVVGAL